MDNFNNKDFQNHVEQKMPKPSYIRNIVWAFIVGGLICLVGQVILNYISNRGLNQEDAANATTIILIFIGALLTGLGLYEKLGKKAGAGAIIPITGFANSIVAPAMEYKREGFVLGVAAKMFTISGPVLVYGIGSSIIVGIIYLLINK